MGSLAFELPNGRMQLPPASEFIACLGATLAPRLEAVFLNGCQTSDLGHQIVSQLPHLKAISWSTLTEDAAARSFALGFYDAVGSYVAAGSRAIEEAYGRGSTAEDGRARRPPPSSTARPPHHLVLDFRGCGLHAVRPWHRHPPRGVGGEDDGGRCRRSRSRPAARRAAVSTEVRSHYAEVRCSCLEDHADEAHLEWRSTVEADALAAHARGGAAHGVGRAAERWTSVGVGDIALAYGSAPKRRLLTIGLLSGLISGAIQSLERRVSAAPPARRRGVDVPARSGAADDPRSARGNGGWDVPDLDEPLVLELGGALAQLGGRDERGRR